MDKINDAEINKVFAQKNKDVSSLNQFLRFAQNPDQIKVNKSGTHFKFISNGGVNLELTVISSMLIQTNYVLPH